MSKRTYYEFGFGGNGYIEQYRDGSCTLQTHKQTPHGLMADTRTGYRSFKAALKALERRTNGFFKEVPTIACAGAGQGYAKHARAAR